MLFVQEIIASALGAISSFGDKGGSTVDTELIVDFMQVNFDGPLGDIELARNCFV